MTQKTSYNVPEIKAVVESMELEQLRSLAAQVLYMLYVDTQADEINLDKEWSGDELAEIAFFLGATGIYRNLCEAVGIDPEKDDEDPMIMLSDDEDPMIMLRDELEPGFTLWTQRLPIWPGLSGKIHVAVFYVHNEQLIFITDLVASVLNLPYEPTTEGLFLDVEDPTVEPEKILITRLSHVLYPDGFGCVGHGCPSTDHAQGPDGHWIPHKHPVLIDYRQKPWVEISKSPFVSFADIDYIHHAPATLPNTESDVVEGCRYHWHLSGASAFHHRMI